MKQRSHIPSSVVFVILIVILSCPFFLVFSSAVRHALYTVLGKTGSATLVYEDATLVVIPMPTEPPIINHVPGTTYQAIGVLLPRPDGYELRSLATESSVVVEENKPLAVSQDRAYLQVGDQQVRLSDWTLVELLDREWEPLRKNVGTSTSSDSRNSQVTFKIRSSVEGYALIRGDWRIDTFVPHGPNRVRYYGVGRVQQAGWSPDQQSIYIANDGRILAVSLHGEPVR